MRSWIHLYPTLETLLRLRTSECYLSCIWQTTLQLVLIEKKEKEKGLMPLPNVETFSRTVFGPWSHLLVAYSGWETKHGERLLFTSRSIHFNILPTVIRKKIRENIHSNTDFFLNSGVEFRFGSCWISIFSRQRWATLGCDTSWSARDVYTVVSRSHRLPPPKSRSLFGKTEVTQSPFIPFMFTSPPPKAQIHSDNREKKLHPNALIYS